MNPWGVPQGDIDRLTSLAALVCDVPVALVTFEGASVTGPPDPIVAELFPDPSLRELTAANGTTFVVPDLLDDATMAAHPLTDGEAGIRFYAGHPLILEGEVIGTLSVLDHAPRELTAEQADGLRLVAEQVVALVAAWRATSPDSPDADRRQADLR